MHSQLLKDCIALIVLPSTILVEVGKVCRRKAAAAATATAAAAAFGKCLVSTQRVKWCNLHK